MRAREVLPVTQPMRSTRRRTVTPASLSLLGGFSLIVDGAAVSLPIHAQRVLAYVSLAQPLQAPTARAPLAERLWREASADRSHASLRTALWRIRQAGPHLVGASRDTVWLDEAVQVDVRRCVAQARRLLAADGDLGPNDTDITVLRGELLPRWEEDWLLLERERVRQVQIHALEALARRLCALGRHFDAMDAAFAAIDGEPLRESAHAALIDIFIAEGDWAQAHRQLDRYASLLWSELGIRPSADLVNRLGAYAPLSAPRAREAEVVQSGTAHGGRRTGPRR
jgi:DNA-binding SARP family transcriptional activator